MAENPTNPLFVPDGNAQDGSLIEAQNALLKMMEPEKEVRYRHDNDQNGAPGHR